MITDSKPPEIRITNRPERNRLVQIPDRQSVELRHQKKFSRPVRLALWLGLPLGLWGAIILLARGLL